MVLRAVLCGLALMVSGTSAVRADDPIFNDRKMSEWLTMLKEDPQPRKRRAAIVALGQIAIANRDATAPALIAVGKALQVDANAAVREQAATVIGQQKTDDAAVVLNDLAIAMRMEKDVNVRREVAIVLGRFGKLAKVAVTPLIAALKDADSQVKTAAADALGRIGPEAKDAAPSLLTLISEKDKAIRQAAIFALGRINPDDKTTPSLALVQVLKSEKDVELRREIVVSLGFLGESKSEVLTALVAELADSDPDFRTTVVLSLGKFGPAIRSAETALTNLLKNDPDKAVRQHVVRTLCRGLGSDVNLLIPVLTERLKADADFEVRVAIAEELGALGLSAKSAIPILRVAQRDAQIKVREAATKAIKAIESPTPKKEK